MSEFGFQSLPPYKTIQTYAAPEDRNMTSYIMEHHQRSGSGNGLMIGQMTDTFRMPKDFQSLVYLSMVLQAEGIRYGVEHWRRASRAGQRHADLAVERLLAGGLLVEHRLLWALEGAALCSTQILRSDPAFRRRPGGTAWDCSSPMTPPWPGPARCAGRWKRWQANSSTRGCENVSAAALAVTPVWQAGFQRARQRRKPPPGCFHRRTVEGQELLARQVATFAPNKHLELVDTADRDSKSPTAGRTIVHPVENQRPGALR